MEKWKTIKSEPLVDSRWVKVRKDSVDLPNGQYAAIVLHMESFGRQESSECNER